MSKVHRPEAKYIRQCFRYEDGKLFWLVRPTHHFSSNGHCKRWNNRYSGKESGTCQTNQHGSGYDQRWVIKLDAKAIHRARIVWILHRGSWPSMIDHKNRRSLDDRIENLRIANYSQNVANSRTKSTNKSGFKGAYFCNRSQKWASNIRHNGRNKFLGYFATPQEAHAVYCQAAQKLHGEFACDGEQAIT